MHEYIHFQEMIKKEIESFKQQYKAGARNIQSAQFARGYIHGLSSLLSSVEKEANALEEAMFTESAELKLN